MTIFDEVAELSILWPAIGEALEKDAGVLADAERVSGGTAIGLPVNADVFAASIMLTTEVPALAYWACSVIAEPPALRTVGAHLQHFPRWHERMLVTAALAEAAHLAVAVRSMLASAKLALGLRTPDRRLGQYCPMHDDPLCELIMPGDVATLRYTRLDRDGRPVTPAVEWTRREAAVCSACSASWEPGDYLALGRLMRQADARRSALKAAS